MINEISEHDGLAIQLLSCYTPSPFVERFYFLEMSTLQATTIISPEREIIKLKFFGSNYDDIYIDQKIQETFKTINDFNNFFIENQDYYIDNCHIEMNNELTLSSHDDGEVSIQISKDSSDIQIFRYSDIQIIEKLFKSYNIDLHLLPILRTNPNHLIEIDTKSHIIARHKSFDDYLKSIK